MAYKFVTAHAGAKNVEARVNDIFAVRQTMGKRLREFLARFNRVRMSLTNLSEGMAVAAFQNRLSRDGSRATKKLLSRLMKYPPTTWEEIHNAYCAEARADEDDLNGPTRRLKTIHPEIRRDRLNERRQEKVPCLNRERHRPYVRSSHPPPPRSSVRTREAEQQGTMTNKDDPTTRKSNALCEFHQERGHKPEDCIGLRQEVVRMMNQGFLREILNDKGKLNLARGREQPHGPPRTTSPTRTINMIIGDGNNSAINHVKFTTTHKLKRTITHERYDDIEDSITFDKSDVNGLSFPHYDTLVITLCIVDTDVRRIMVNDGSDALERTSGEVTRSGGRSQDGNHFPCDEPRTYNTIIGRPWIIK
uniref:Reverse transcriptase domain-containing protein n=1 Tax=Nicotiana tabacum TaxID=4097 RepID=A0A1S4C747_TOBAC|nr:PREDICTED: uncharacterized protein LOC107815841 [Nicotiana tabacum]